jgi:hypothetical protein
MMKMKRMDVVTHLSAQGRPAKEQRDRRDEVRDGLNHLRLARFARFETIL